MGARRPRKIQLGPLKWKVRFVDARWVDADGDEAVGYCDCVHLEIVVASRRPAAAIRQTFVHELIHALAYSYGLIVPKRGDDDEREEAVCVSWAVPWWQFMEHNPKTVSWLQDS